ncbi:MAG: CRTAC1 family protein [Phycisphaerales bacterium]|nr:CRTAC1 family protein [Phycisphaerales bacterium]
MLHRVRSTTIRSKPTLALGLLLITVAPSAAGDPSLLFTDQTEQAGLTSQNAQRSGQLYAVMIAGGVAADFNNDGYHDILQLGSLNPNKLFINNQDGTFTDHAESWNINGPFHSYGASVADFNNDGYLDVYITAFGPAHLPPQAGQNLLMMNNGPDSDGNWYFTDVAQSAGVHRLLQNNNAPEGAGSAWGDYDLDGDLDLFVTAYSPITPANRLFRNDGPDHTNTWRFTDVTQEAGLEQTGLRGFLPAFIDMNNDRYPELFIVGDFGTSRHYTNNHDGTFTNVTTTLNNITTANAMGVDIADVNHDGLLDMFVSNIRWVNPPIGGNLLLIQQPDNSFVDTAAQSDCLFGHWGWGSLINDFDHDGDKDILEVNGIYGFGPFSTQPATFYLNDGDGTSFTEAAEVCGIAHRGQGRGLVRLDADNDGDIDTMIFNHLQPNAYFRNELLSPKSDTTGKHWSRIKLDTYARDSLAPQGIGAMVTLSTPTRDYLLPIHSNPTYCGSSPAETHIGLADESQIVSIQIAWPDGSFTTVTNPPVDSIINIVATSHPADYDASGEVNFSDVIEFASRLKSRALTADHNGDGVVDFFDISTFLSDFRGAIAP